MTNKEKRHMIEVFAAPELWYNLRVVYYGIPECRLQDMVRDRMHRWGYAWLPGNLNHVIKTLINEQILSDGKARRRGRKARKAKRSLWTTISLLLRRFAGR